MIDSFISHLWFDLVVVFTTPVFWWQTGKPVSKKPLLPFKTEEEFCALFQALGNIKIAHSLIILTNLNNLYYVIKSLNQEYTGKSSEEEHVC